MPRRVTEKPSLAHKLRVDVHAAWLSARDPRTPWFVRIFGLLLTAYALSPVDLIPDFIPILGLVDDAIIIPVGLWIYVRTLSWGVFHDNRLKSQQAAEKPGSTWGAAIVVTIWILAALLFWRLLAPDFD